MTTKLLQYFMRTSLSILFLLFSIFSYAQTNYCATPPTEDKWLETYQQQPHLYEKGGNELIYIPMTIHLVGNDEGKGYFPISDLLDALCVVNEDFIPANIQFFIKNIRYIQRTAWYNHDNFAPGAEMQRRNNVSNTMNTYFVSNASNACGYAVINSISTVITNSCSNSGEHTWSHELGHALSLPHTFRGWEGSEDFDYSTPAPKFIGNDRDSTLVELTDKSNCDTAGDRFCDTEPDYLSERWTCNGSQRSATQQIDPNGQKFTSDGTLIMGYADDNCTSRFSPEQIQAIRANIFSQKATLVNQTISDGTISESEPIVLSSPLDNQTVGFQNIFFEWEPVAQATKYMFQVSRLPTFSVLAVDTIVSTNTLILPELPIRLRYYWRILPYNNYSTCGSFSTRKSFLTAEETTSTVNLTESQISVSPTLLTQPGQLQIQVKDVVKADLRIELFDITGKLIIYHQTERNAGTDLQLFVEDNPPGIYTLRVTIANQQFVRKIVLQ